MPNNSMQTDKNLDKRNNFILEFVKSNPHLSCIDISHKLRDEHGIDLDYTTIKVIYRKLGYKKQNPKTVKNNQLFGKSEQVSEPEPMQEPTELPQEIMCPICKVEQKAFCEVMKCPCGNKWVLYEGWEIKKSAKPTQPIEQEIESLKKITTELADNLELAHGVRTCKVCGHTPEVLYKEVEKLVDQAIINERKRILKLADQYDEDRKRPVPGTSNFIKYPMAYTLVKEIMSNEALSNPTTLDTVKEGDV